MIVQTVSAAVKDARHKLANALTAFVTAVDSEADDVRES